MKSDFCFVYIHIQLDKLAWRNIRRRLLNSNAVGQWHLERTVKGCFNHFIREKKTAKFSMTNFNFLYTRRFRQG